MLPALSLYLKLAFASQPELRDWTTNLVSRCRCPWVSSPQPSLAEPRGRPFKGGRDQEPWVAIPTFSTMLSK